MVLPVIVGMVLLVVTGGVHRERRHGMLFRQGPEPAFGK